MNPPVVSTSAPLVGGVAVCALDRLTPNRGSAALVEGVAVAVFLLEGGELCAIDNVDPFCGASILSRGLVGDVDGEPTVASPMYKQRFSLRTGRCLDEPDVAVRVHAVRAADGIVVLRLAP